MSSFAGGGDIVQGDKAMNMYQIQVIFHALFHTSPKPVQVCGVPVLWLELTAAFTLQTNSPFFFFQIRNVPSSI